MSARCLNDCPTLSGIPPSDTEKVVLNFEEHKFVMAVSARGQETSRTDQLYQNPWASMQCSLASTLSAL
jgi:hypothetical protein